MRRQNNLILISVSSIYEWPNQDCLCQDLDRHDDLDQDLDQYQIQFLDIGLYLDRKPVEKYSGNDHEWDPEQIL